ncbi:MULTISPECIES: GntR family transcriptional regulator [unclassified Mesorhizobium]|uniref:GntR family transcriptional regulator n=1 Tax=unclassified Mesorhizobium TaxID=325217 RepID=UPI000FDBDA18|nr:MULTISPECIES: GntR family transcriptional regulator [unclassified Mesorhizobium]TGS16825.1 GntR family transcriptional regulator [Mesorhizobium sp. M2E.F.Ca.ET.209.01.1.1]TGT65375.1 GntR family transcriptional regulator [Mesorhizobium sp. M2E.F.Ca.ET.166.01.1.1]TGV97421.1 GntR family transcriptional regulator [Mesorhizobium sp. M2E.F.Ca.ET.154.01.1.1]
MEQATRTRGRPRYDQEDAEAAEAFRSIGSKVQLNRDEAAPLWVQLRNQVEEAINTGLLAANSRIPSEQALCDFFGVSRPVVRAAIGSLSNEGRIIKMPRKGMFVAAPREHVDFMTANLGVFDDLTAKGHKVSTRTLEIYRCPPSEKESKVFGIPANGSVVRISRVYMTDGTPITMTRISLPGHRVPGLENILSENQSIFGTIRAVFGLTVKRADRWLRAALPTKEEADEMGVAANTPLIEIESIAYDSDGAALEYYEAFYNSSVARIHMAVEQPSATVNGLDRT